MKAIWHVPGIYTPNLDFWNLCTYSYETNPGLWERLNFVGKSKTCCNSSHVMGSKYYVGCT